MSLQIPHVYWARLSAKVTALLCMQGLPRNIDDIDATIAKNIREANTNLKTRPCVILPGKAQHSSRLHSGSSRQLAVCILATFEGTPFHELPEIYQKTIAPLNGSLQPSRHSPIHTYPIWKSKSHADQEYVICIDFMTDTRRIGGQITNYGKDAHLDDDNLALLLDIALSSTNDIVEEAALSAVGEVKLRGMVQASQRNAAEPKRIVHQSVLDCLCG